MTHRMRAALFISIIAVFGAARGHAQATEPAQAAATAALPAPVQKIVTKDPEYGKLLNPPQGNDFLRTYSKAYRDKAVEIEAKVGGITDENLQSQARNEEWITAHKNDGDKFTYEAETALRDAKISFSQRHRDGWFELGRVAYDENNSVLAVITNSTAPIDANLRVPLKVATLNQVYEKFHEIAAQEIDRKAHEHVSNAGVGSNCSRNPDWCYQFAKADIEQALRSARMVVVAQGDLETMRIDRLLLVDYDTEAVLLELDAHVSGLASSGWRFSVGPVPTMPVEQVATETQGQPAAAASAEAGPSPNQNTESAKTGRVSVPGNVTSVSIVTQTKPEYPPEARAGNIQGEVVLHAIIDKEGKISEVHVLAGDDLLAKAAMEAVRQWRYKPMLVDGEPKEVDTTIIVTFSLKD